MKRQLSITLFALLSALPLAGPGALAQAVRVHHVSHSLRGLHVSAADGVQLYSTLGQSHSILFHALVVEKRRSLMASLIAPVSQESEDVGAAVEDALFPTDFALRPNYPNPFNPLTTIAFDLPESRVVQLVVYDVMGRRIDTLVDGVLGAGQHKVQWEARSLATGVYFYRITAGDFVQVKEMLLIK